MEQKTVYYDDWRKEYIKREKKAKRKERYEKIKDFCVEYKSIIVPIAITTGVGAITGGTKLIAKMIKLNKEKSIKDLYCYDRSLGHYWALRRELTNKEWLEIDARKRNGEKLADILDELKVLK